jgi:hypothetical protein
VSGAGRRFSTKDHPFSSSIIPQEESRLRLTRRNFLECGGLDFGIVVDRDAIDDAWTLTDALRRAQAELVSLINSARSIRSVAPTK